MDRFFSIVVWTLSAEVAAYFVLAILLYRSGGARREGGTRRAVPLPTGGGRDTADHPLIPSSNEEGNALPREEGDGSWN